MTGLFALAVASASTSAQGSYPKIEAYRLCGIRVAARLERERPGIAPEVLARDATLRCEAVLGAAAEETLARAGQPHGRSQVMADFRQRSIADLAHKISTLRASKK